MSFLCERAVSESTQDRSEIARRQPMHQGQDGMELDGKPTVRRRHEEALAADAPQLGQKSCLIGSRPDMLDDGARVREVEGAVRERQLPAIGAPERHAGVNLLEKRGIVESDRGDPRLVRIPGLEVIRMIVRTIACCAHIDNRVLRLDTKLEKEAAVHSSALMPSDPHGEALRRSDVVLSVDGHRFNYRAILKTQWWRLKRWPWLALLAGGCVLAGALARFWAIGRWPLAVDEYYIAESVRSILRTGIPELPCGGFYGRGLLLQYGAAALQLASVGPELAPRLIAAVSSLAALPAVYVLGRRLAGPQIGLAAVAIVALSVWEVEVARFGRMYAPFQAIFLWYLVCFVRYTIDGVRGALAGMIALSALGALVWEGGAMIVATSLLPPFLARPSGRLERRDAIYLAGMAICLALVWRLANLNTVGMNDAADLPANYEEATRIDPSRLAGAIMPLLTLRAHPAWAVVALVPAAIALLAAARILRELPARERPAPALGLAAAVGCVLAQQIELAGAIVLLLLLIGAFRAGELFSRPMLAFHASVLASTFFWVAYSLATSDWVAPGVSLPRKLLLLGFELTRFPDILRVIAVPWGRTVPVLSAALLALLAGACLHAITRPANTSRSERAFLLIFVGLLLCVGAADPPRFETRYVFFLYPLALLIALTTIARGARAILPSSRLALPAGVLAALCAFALAEDFQPRHLWNIGTYAINYRIGMSDLEADHYQNRSETRSAAIWLSRHVDARHDLIINTFPGVDFYFPNMSFFFMPDSDPRFENWSCRHGTVARWSNRPLIHTLQGLEAELASGRRTWMVVETARFGPFLSKLPGVRSRVEWSSRAGDISIISLQFEALQTRTISALQQR